MTRAFRPCCALLFAALVVVSTDARAQAAVVTGPVEVLSGVENRIEKDIGKLRPGIPKELKGIEILDKVGNLVPQDIQLTDHEGRAVTFGEYTKDGKPVVLVLGYYACPTLCSVILNGTMDALKAINLDAGRDYHLVAVSIDETETPALAQKKRANYLKNYDRDGGEAGWHFLVGEESEVRRLADAVGFGYRWDETSQQFAHAGGIFFLSPQQTAGEAGKAKLTRTLWGMSFSPRDVKFALIDASDGKVGSVTDKILLSCFSYTPDSQRYSVYIFGVMRLAGVVTILFLGFALFFLWRRFERRVRRRRSTSHHSTK